MSPAQITAVKVSGTAEFTYARRETVDVPGQEGHVLIVGESRGRNRNTGTEEFFNDAEAVTVELTDLRQPGGTQQGYISMSQGKDSALAKWQGIATVKAGAAQQPQISFRGTWEYIHGTGRYAGIQGDGTYEGEFVDEERYVVTWEGERQAE